MKSIKKNLKKYIQNNISKIFIIYKQSLFVISSNGQTSQMKKIKILL